VKSLERYRAKRDPARTPEPFGGAARGAAPKGASGAFVVQEHHARRRHWDLRLEVDGVLASWAVPRGPSLDPGERRLAVRTEDHPLEYADFEGVIPSGNYGAGAMIVWDRGVYRCVAGGSAAEALEAGKLDLLLEGHKLRGRFALVRTRGEGGRNWLLLAKRSASVGEGEVVERLPASVLSGLTAAELASGAARDAELADRARALGAPRRDVPRRELRPMLATAERTPFEGEGWLFELKIDGMRVLAQRDGAVVRILSRTGADRTATYPEVAEALARLPVERFVLDGEIAALDTDGRPSFEMLQQRIGLRDPRDVARARAEIPVTLFAFDLLAVAGFDVRGLALRERKALLARVVPRRGVVSFADHVEADGLALFESARDRNLEGVVAKRADSPYQSGRRATTWRKLKAPRRSSLAIVGWLPGRGSRRELGSLMLAWRDGDSLVYAGNVGSGLDAGALETLRAELEAARVPKPACTGLPARLPRGRAFVRPGLVCDVRYTETTSAGLLRHPVFDRLRPDLSPEACHAPPRRETGSPPRREAEPPPPAAPRAADRGPAPEAAPALTRLDKVFWPDEGYTKGDLLAWYEAVWPWLEPYLRDRPVVLTRYPDGIAGKHFYQKNAPEFTPAWVRREAIDGTDYFVCNDLPTLLYVVNTGAIPLHVWSARLASIDRPDWLIVDLDPKGAPFAHVVEVARHLHTLLAELGAAHFVKTSGQDGLHVLVPLGARLGHAEARALAEVLARVVCSERPDIATAARPLAARGGKVYVDYLQNGRGKLIAAPFSVRPRGGAPVSMPLRWSQVTRRLDPARFTIRTALARLRRGGDPVRGVLGAPVDVVALLAALAARLETDGAGG
jgi:bifunctional non-homologous end joining protein LigD